MEEENNATVFWSLFTCESWRMYLAASHAGIVYIGSQNKPFEELAAWVSEKFSGSKLIQDDQMLRPYADELAGYMQGNRNAFAMPTDLRGTPFQLAVWDALRQIPHGQTQSYSDIADYIRKPAAVRAVGAAIGANPVLIAVPCHRVIGKNGALTGYRGGLEMKTQLLQLEQRFPVEHRTILHKREVPGAGGMKGNTLT